MTAVKNISMKWCMMRFISKHILLENDKSSSLIRSYYKLLSFAIAEMVVYKMPKSTEEFFKNDSCSLNDKNTIYVYILSVDGGLCHAYLIKFIFLKHNFSNFINISKTDCERFFLEFLFVNISLTTLQL